jgi:hypothetical protein
MQKITLTIRFIVFCVFFLTGAGAVVLAILAEPELKTYYQSRAALNEIQQQNTKLKILTEKYAAQIALIESEPNILQRFIPLTLGQKPQAPDTAFPQVQDSALQTETEKLLERIENTPAAEPVPTWLSRVIKLRNRRGLFCSGAALIFVTCIYFGTAKTDPPS